MLGVHGNGLTHLLWMPATPRSAVIEMFFVGGFAHDCESDIRLLDSYFVPFVLPSSLFSQRNECSNSLKRRSSVLFVTSHHSIRSIIFIFIFMVDDASEAKVGPEN